MPRARPTMRALVFTGPAPSTSRTKIDEIAVPSPGPGQLSIDVTHAGVNFKDVMSRRGDAGYVDTWPFIPGLDAAGHVREVGEGVTAVGVGDRVAALTGTGGLAEVAIADADLTCPVPAALDLRRAAAAPGALVTAALLVEHIGRLRGGERVLVHGATGGVGRAVARLARLSGAGLVLGTTGSPSRAVPTSSLGYDAIEVRGPGLAERIRERTGGDGIDVVLDPQGSALLSLDMEVAAPGARIVVFGNATGAPFAALPPLGQLFAANVSIAGFSLAALAATAPTRVTAALAQVLQHLATGVLDVDIQTVDGLAGAPAAQQALAEGRAPGKQVVDVMS